MGLAYFEKMCPAGDVTTKTVQAWCVLKEGTCCAVCPNNLATVGSRIGLIALVLFATLVVVYDAAEAPFNFLTVSMSSVAYLVAVLQAGLRGNQISKFHAYYALFASLGFLSPLAAISVSPNSYLYGESHPKLGKKLLPFSRKMGRRSATAPKNSTSHSLGHALDSGTYRRLQDSVHEMYSMGHGSPEPHFSAPRRAATDTMLGRSRAIPSSARRGVSSFWTSNRTDAPSRVAERRPLAETDPFRIGDTSTETSPDVRAGSPRARRAELSEGEPPEALLPGAMLPLSGASPLSRSHTLPPSHAPHTVTLRRSGHQATFFDDSSSASGADSSGEEEAKEEKRSHAGTSALAQERPRHSSSYEKERHLRWENPRTPPLPPNHEHGRRRLSSGETTAAEPSGSLDTTLDPSPLRSPRRRLTKRQRPLPPQHGGHALPLPRPPRLSKEEIEARMALHSVDLTEEDKEYIYQKMQGSSWRRRAYIGGNLALWVIWLVAFLLVAGAFPSHAFTFSQADCEDPAGTKLLYYSIVAFLCIGFIIIIVFIVNFYSHFFSHSIHRPFSYSRAHSRLTRTIVPGTFSLVVFSLWQILLWLSYEQAASNDSSLQAADEQATSFTTVLACALAIKPFLDIVKAIAKARKLRMKQMKERDVVKVLEEQARRESRLAREVERGDGEAREEGKGKGKGVE